MPLQLHYEQKPVNAVQTYEATTIFTVTILTLIDGTNTVCYIGEKLQILHPCKFRSESATYTMDPSGMLYCPGLLIQNISPHQNSWIQDAAGVFVTQHSFCDLYHQCGARLNRPVLQSMLLWLSAFH